jgi:hypothetical protein
MANQTLPQIKPFNGREMQAIEYLMAMDAKFANAGDAMRVRLNHLPYGWRDWRLMVSLCRKLLRQVYDTLPDKSLRYMNKLREGGEVLIRFTPASRSPGWVLVLENDLRDILNAAMAAECSVCMKQGKAIDRCVLRRAMIDIAPPHDGDDTATGCGYRMAVVASEYGDYV